MIGLAPTQAPAWQLSAEVHKLPSLQAVPFVLGVATQAPVAGLHAPRLQALFNAEQSTAVPDRHCLPALQVSTPLQGLPSSQSAAVSQAQFLESTVQPPSCSEQLSVVHAILSSQVMAFPVQVPPTQVSGPWHTEPSLQAVPSGLAGLLHRPVLLSQVPAEWQLFDAGQVTWLAGVHTPAWQASPLVQGLASLHLTPSCLLGLEQMPVAASHTPAT